MPNDVSLTFDATKLERDSAQVVRRYLVAGRDAVADATKGLERALEGATRGAVPGQLWRAWKSDVYPRRGPARDPVGTVFVNGGTRSRGAITFWTQPGAVRGKAGQYLAIPLPAAGSRGRGRSLSPGDWERRTGQRLRFVYRPGRASLLVADQAVLSGKGQIARGNTAKRIAAGRGSATVPIFVLLKVVPFRNAVAIEPLVAQAEAALVASFFTHVARS
jgi:hypothetical protein